MDAHAQTAAHWATKYRWSEEKRSFLRLDNYGYVPEIMRLGQDLVPSVLKMAMFPNQSFDPVQAVAFSKYPLLTPGIFEAEEPLRSLALQVLSNTTVIISDLKQWNDWRASQPQHVLDSIRNIEVRFDLQTYLQVLCWPRLADNQAVEKYLKPGEGYQAPDLTTLRGKGAAKATGLLFEGWYYKSLDLYCRNFMSKLVSDAPEGASILFRLPCHDPFNPPEGLGRQGFYGKTDFCHFKFLEMEVRLWQMFVTFHLPRVGRNEAAIKGLSFDIIFPECCSEEQKARLREISPKDLYQGSLVDRIGAKSNGLVNLPQVCQCGFNCTKVPGAADCCYEDRL